MSERDIWIRLQDSWTWIDAEFSTWKRLEAGWILPDPVLATIFKSKQVKFRGRDSSLERQLLKVDSAHVRDVTVTAFLGKLTITSERRSQPTSLLFPQANSLEFSDVEINAADLRAHCGDILGRQLARGGPIDELAADLATAPEPKIREAIAQAYDEVRTAGGKPPNIKELSGYVAPILSKQGLKASQLQIQKIGDGPEFKRRRIKPGTRFRP